MEKRNYYFNLIRFSASASLLISLGNYVLLKIGEPIGPFLFAFGLLGVCILGLNLFTGKCGYLVEDKIRPLDLFLILATNLLFGYAIGILFSLTDESIVEAALAKVVNWDFSWAFFLKSILCGVIMYLAVELYRRGTTLGILLGVPLFLFAGFQHSIANIITMGVAIEFSWSILLAIAGNFIGSLAAWGLTSSFPPTTSETPRRTATARRTATTRKSTTTRRTARATRTAKKPTRQTAA